MTKTTVDALHSLKPNAEWALMSDGSLVWHDKKQTKPTDKELADEVVRLQAEYDAQQYIRDRKAEYPSLEECIHAILDDGLEELQAKRQAVKQKFPKG